MKLSTAIAAALLGAEASIASPVNLVRRTPRMSKRGASRSTHPLIPVSGGSSATGELSGIAQTDYSSNWAGAVLIGSGYKSVYGTFTVPTPKLPSGADDSTTYSASAWVGLDGDTCETSILQTGVDFNIEGTEISFDAWYEWYPDYAYDFEGFDISAGDVIKLNATAKSTSSGSVVIENLTTGKSVSHSFSGESDKLCETNAEWIVEDFEENGSLVPLVDFGTVTFTDAGVGKTDGSTVGVDGATIIDLKQDSTVLTKVTIVSDSSVKVVYE